jgi:hypothetical protein
MKCRGMTSPSSPSPQHGQANKRLLGVRIGKVENIQILLFKYLQNLCKQSVHSFNYILRDSEVALAVD